MLNVFYRLHKMFIIRTKVESTDWGIKKQQWKKWKKNFPLLRNLLVHVTPTQTALIK